MAILPGTGGGGLLSCRTSVGLEIGMLWSISMKASLPNCEGGSEGASELSSSGRAKEFSTTDVDVGRVPAISSCSVIEGNRGGNVGLGSVWSPISELSCAVAGMIYGIILRGTTEFQDTDDIMGRRHVDIPKISCEHPFVSYCCRKHARSFGESQTDVYRFNSWLYCRIRPAATYLRVKLQIMEHSRKKEAASGSPVSIGYGSLRQKRSFSIINTLRRLCPSCRMTYLEKVTSSLAPAVKGGSPSFFRVTFTAPSPREPLNPASAAE